ncbi:MAG: SixA phosphatase family protein [Chitinophagaceae bacterium]
MKTLLLIRHAKSSWDNPLQKDFDRPLNKRGKHNAPKMAKRLYKKKIKIDLFITSPAARALATCKYFADEYDIKEKKIIKVPEFYEDNANQFYPVLTELNDDYNCVAIVAHSPAIINFANELTETKIDKMPTCAVFAVKIDIEQWKDFATAKKEFWFFIYPKLKE